MQRSPTAGGRLNEESSSKLLEVDRVVRLYMVNVQAVSFREAVRRVEPTRSSDDTLFSSTIRNFEEILNSAGPEDSLAWGLWDVQTENEWSRQYEEPSTNYKVGLFLSLPSQHASIFFVI